MAGNSLGAKLTDNVKLLTIERNFFPLDLPTLDLSVEKGGLSAFWFVKDQYPLKMYF